MTFVVISLEIYRMKEKFENSGKFSQAFHPK